MVDEEFVRIKYKRHEKKPCKRFDAFRWSKASEEIVRLIAQFGQSMTEIRTVLLGK
jgi:hypothetical protein